MDDQQGRTFQVPYSMLEEILGLDIALDALLQRRVSAEPEEILENIRCVKARLRALAKRVEQILTEEEDEETEYGSATPPF